MGGKENASEPVGCPQSTPPCTAIRHCGAMRLFLCPRGCASGSSLRRCTEYHGLTVTDGPTPLCTCASSMVLRGIHNNMLFFFQLSFRESGGVTETVGSEKVEPARLIVHVPQSCASPRRTTRLPEKMLNIKTILQHENCCKMRIFLQSSVAIQPHPGGSLLKFRRRRLAVRLPGNRGGAP